MANSKYEYVKQYELPHILLPGTYIVVRIDGKGFHKFTDFYKFTKPNDLRGLQLMNEAAKMVVQTFPDVWLAYGQSDEYSFVLERHSELYKRRSDKIATMVCSVFTAAYAYHFESKMCTPLVLPYLAVFDARCVCYPDLPTLRDYLAWRQVDCHINNLYNTCFWSLVGRGVTRSDAEKQLAKTNAGEKNELLFSEFNVNYNTIADIFKKGSIILKQLSLQEKGVPLDDHNQQQQDRDAKLSRKERKKLKYKALNQVQQVSDVQVDVQMGAQMSVQIDPQISMQSQIEQSTPLIQVLHVDLIKNDFWIQFDY